MTLTEGRGKDFHSGELVIRDTVWDDVQKAKYHLVGPVECGRDKKRCFPWKSLRNRLIITFLALSQCIGQLGREEERKGGRKSTSPSVTIISVS